MGGAARALAFIAALAGAFLIAAIALRPPPERRQAGDDFSLPAAMVHIRAIAKAPHTVGSPAQAQVRAYLVEELSKLGLSVETQPFPLPEPVQKRLARWKVPAQEGVNIVGVLPGKDRTLPPVLVMAHYDSVPNSPGAADDAAGVAAALEAARVMKGHNRRDLIVLLTDGEEPGLTGARAYFATPRKIGAVVNLESRGGGGRAALFETGEGSGQMMRLFADQVANPSAHSFAMLVYKYLPNDTDFSPARKLGLPGFNIAFIGDPGLYHSPLSTPDRVDPGSVRHLGQVALDTVRALDGAKDFKSGGEYPVFSDVFGLFLITHSPAMGWISIAVAAVGIALAFALAVRSEAWRWKGLVAGLAAGLLLVLVLGAALYGMNIVSGTEHGGYYERLAATGWLEISATLLCLAAVLALPRRQMGPMAGFVGLLLLGLILAIVVQVTAPQAGPLFAWPLLAASLAAVPLAASTSPLWRAPPLILLVIAAAFVLIWAHIVFVAAGQQYPSVLAPFAFLAAMCLWPFLQALPGRRAIGVIALVLLLGSTGIAMKVWLAPPSPFAATYDR